MITSKSRISWIEYAKRLAQTAALRSEDPWTKVGSVALRADNSVAGLGYNGGPSGIEINWGDREGRRARVIHSEVNTLRYCKPGEVDYMVTTLMPCPNCLTVIASYGIKKVYYCEEYMHKPPVRSIADEFGIVLEKI